MNFARLAFCALIFAPCVAGAASDEFVMATELLTAARSADIQRVQVLVNNGANINYIDSTGLSLVCTAVMNNDVRTAQILQMYGADASQCDRQIKNFTTQNSPGTSEGIWGGLSTAQSMTLSAVGAGAVVAGLFLLTDVFDHDNDNWATSGGSGSGSGGGSSSGGGGTTNTGTPMFGTSGLPYGPASLKTNYNYANEFEIYYAQNLSSSGNSTVENPFYQSFILMNAYENYLLLMRGYSPFARGYFGMRTLRDANYAPLSLSNAVSGGRPVNVALVTANGVNATDDSSLSDSVYFAWQDSTSSTVTGISNKYYNNLLSNSGTVSPATEDTNLLSSFDLSGSGTAIHNSLAIGDDNTVAKIVGGYTPAGGITDLFGFMPNGQLTIYRTGGGRSMVALDSPVNAGTCTGDTISNNDTVGLFDKTLTATVSGNAVSLTDGTDTYNGYIGADGLLYMDSDGDGVVDMGYTLSDGLISQTKQLETSDYYNYSALAHALVLRSNDIGGSGRSKTDVIANTNVISPLHNRNAAMVDSITAVGPDNYETMFYNLIGQYYGTNSSVSSGMLPAANALAFYEFLNQSSLYQKTNSMDGTLSLPLIVFSTGASTQDTTTSTYLDPVQSATFENAAPIVYSNLEHLFMSVVAVGTKTNSATAITPNTNGVPESLSEYQLAQWNETVNGTTTYYKSRICGLAGNGNNGAMDPWCFAAVGLTDEAAVASAAGAAGILASAFHYMSAEQIFLLLALTADGPYLGRLTTASGTGSGVLLSDSELVSYLRSMYKMPNEYDTNDDAQYLENFKQVYGYGVINLERATTPGTNLYFFDGNNIVSSGNNDAYWRAATNTGLRSSGALNFGRNAINISAYDILESNDGSMQLPRVWENIVSFGNDGRHALYMGDVLGDLQTSLGRDTSEKIGNLSFNIARSERSYDDGMGGLDNMRFDYETENWNLSADYQRYLTDGESRFYGMANPILALASNTVSGGFGYKFGNWLFGARAFSGAITDEGLLASDPAISATYEPMNLGTVDGAMSTVGWKNNRFGINTAFGIMHESGTVLGAVASGLFDLSGTDTMYMDADLFWMPFDSVRVRARATFAHSTPTMQNETAFGLSTFDSNAFAIGAEFGNLNVGVSWPLAVQRGNMNYAYADYDVVEIGDGRYDIVVSDFGVRSVDLSARSREVRLNALYRHSFGEFTDGAVGFIYRMHPNNTDEFGNESLFMMKMSHRIGI